jgi:hypothetical protein
MRLCKGYNNLVTGIDFEGLRGEVRYFVARVGLVLQNERGGRALLGTSTRASGDDAVVEKQM